MGNSALSMNTRPEMVRYPDDVACHVHFIYSNSIIIIFKMALPKIADVQPLGDTLIALKGKVKAYKSNAFSGRCASVKSPWICNRNCTQTQ
jgi:hypothetical protein